MSSCFRTSSESNGETSLFIAESCVGDAGNYSVRVGSSSSEIKVDIVFSKPLFAVPLEDRKARVGQPVTFTASVTGVPKPSVTWWFGGKPVDDSLARYRSEVSDDSVLFTIAATDEDDIGASCECRASNAAGESISKAALLPGWWHDRPYAAAACSGVRLRVIG